MPNDKNERWNKNMTAAEIKTLLYENPKKLLGNVYSDKLIEYLDILHYGTCPASVKHHGNVRGGLLEHSAQVASELLKLTEEIGLIWQRKESPIIIGLFHDLCKTDDYVMQIKESDELFGGIVRSDSCKIDYNSEPIMKGHGDKSVMMLSTVLQLTEEEMFCIRFHMGAFTDSSEWKFYTNAIHKFPNVLWTHQADMIAAHLMGV